jgi:signal transduction histidine kinase/FixJ family two-component response regulator
MRVTPATAAVPLLLLLLTWLSIRALNGEAELYDRALGALDHFEMAENALRRDVLTARAGVLRNYDRFVQDMRAMDRWTARLRAVADVDAETSAAIERLAATVDRQQALTEQFKSDNALLQNSLAYFGLFSARLGGSDHSGRLAAVLSGLAAAMLHFTLDTSEAAAREVEDRLNDLAALPVSPDDADSVQALLAHARLLHELLPTVDRMLKDLSVQPNRRDEQSLRALILVRQLASREAARWFRFALYATSLLLLAVLVHLGLRLRARAAVLRRRAELEHVIAGVSTRLIDSRPDETMADVEQSLAELAACIGADRAYFILAGAPNRMGTWSRAGVGCATGWPERALELATRLKREGEMLIRVASIDRLPAGADRAALVAAGMRSWVCIPGLSHDDMRAILGFDALRSPITAQADELGLLRMALDAFCNAVRRDILKQERGRLEQHLQQARRMETVGALSSGIAHNFNNIVGAILGYAEIAEAKLVSSSAAAGNLREIRRAGERARDLVDQILDFGRRRDRRRSGLRISDLIAESASLLRVSLPSGITLAVRETSESAVVFGERAQLQQVILNLCNNAAQAMDGAGRIDIDVDPQHSALPRSLSHGELAPGYYVRIAVSDAGRGMDEATLGRVFEPFFTTRVAGTGLGLATVREIVREHGGVLNVRSAPGAGSCFEAWLPCVAGTVAGADDTAPTLPLGRGETVLVVDETPGRLLRVEEILAALGYEPVGFARADLALAACREMPARFDMLVIVDLVPNSSTLELAAALHAIVPKLPILLATGSSEEIDANALVAAGVSDLLRWPVSAADMAVALERCSAAKDSDGTPRLGWMRATMSALHRR